MPVVLNGRIDPAGDEDRFVLAVTPGQKLRIEVDASEHGSALDGVLQVLGAKDAVLATADDTRPPDPARAKKAAAIASPDPSLDFTVPAGRERDHAGPPRPGIARGDGLRVPDPGRAGDAIV